MVLIAVIPGEFCAILSPDIKKTVHGGMTSIDPGAWNKDGERATDVKHKLAEEVDMRKEKALAPLARKAGVSAPKFS
jgi:hypothetical protein